MFECKSIIKITNKKYFLNEYIYILKVYKESYGVLVIDNLNNRVYLEDSYPQNLLEESKIKEYTKKEFLNEIGEKVKIQLNEKYKDIFEEIVTYNEQKSLF